MTTQPIMYQLAAHENLKQRLLAQYPELDDETLLDTLEGMTDLREMIAAVVRTQLDDRALKDALRYRMGDMQERLARLERRIETKKALVTSVMDQSGIKKLEDPEFTVSLRRTARPLLIGDESVIPDEFWQPQPAKLDRLGLINALKAGEAVSGASLGNGGVAISVRTK